MKICEKILTGLIRRDRAGETRVKIRNCNLYARDYGPAGIGDSTYDARFLSCRRARQPTNECREDQEKTRRAPTDSKRRPYGIKSLKLVHRTASTLDFFRHQFS